MIYVFHFWNFNDKPYHTNLSSVLYGYNEFYKIFQKEGCTKELCHDIMVCILEDIKTHVFAYMCTPGFDWHITVFFHKIRMIIFQKIIVEEQLKMIERKTRNDCLADHNRNNSPNNFILYDFNDPSLPWHENIKRN